MIFLKCRGQRYHDSRGYDLFKRDRWCISSGKCGVAYWFRLFQSQQWRRSHSGKQRYCVHQRNKTHSACTGRYRCHRSSLRCVWLGPYFSKFLFKNL